MSDAGFGFFGNEVEDGGAGGFGAGACGCGNGDERGEGFCDGHAFAERGVDEVEEFGLREIGVEIHQFGGVDDAAASHGKKGVWSVVFREVDCFFDSRVFQRMGLNG